MVHSIWFLDHAHAQWLGYELRLKLESVPSLLAAEDKGNESTFLLQRHSRVRRFRSFHDPIHQRSLADSDRLEVTCGRLRFSALGKDHRGKMYRGIIFLSFRVVVKQFLISE